MFLKNIHGSFHFYLIESSCFYTLRLVVGMEHKYLNAIFCHLCLNHEAELTIIELSEPVISLAVRGVLIIISSFFTIFPLGFQDVWQTGNQYSLDTCRSGHTGSKHSERLFLKGESNVSGNIEC